MLPSNFIYDRTFLLEEISKYTQVQYGRHCTFVIICSLEPSVTTYIQLDDRIGTLLVKMVKALPSFIKEMLSLNLRTVSLFWTGLRLYHMLSEKLAGICFRVGQSFMKNFISTVLETGVFTSVFMTSVRINHPNYRLLSRRLEQ